MYRCTGIVCMKLGQGWGSVRQVRGRGGRAWSAPAALLDSSVKHRMISASVRRLRGFDTLSFRVLKALSYLQMFVDFTSSYSNIRRSLLSISLYRTVHFTFKFEFLKFLCTQNRRIVSQYIKYYLLFCFMPCFSNYEKLKLST